MDDRMQLDIKQYDKHLTSRWKVPFGGFLLALMGGVSYSWGVFIIPLMEKYNWSKAQATLPFTVFMVVFAIVMVPAGRFQDKAGPRKASMYGSVLFFLAYGLASLIDRIPSLWWLVITYGVIGGIACGLTYASVAPPVRKWFPDKPGLAVSLAVMGFGLSALLFAPLKVDYLIPLFGINGTFLILAIMTSTLSFVGAWLVKNPPDGWNPLSKKAKSKRPKRRVVVKGELTPREMLKTPVFWLIWITFALVIAGGFISLGLITSYGQKTLGLIPLEAAIATSIFAGFNGFGRPVAGYLGDRLGILWVMNIVYVVQAMILIFFPAFVLDQLSLYIAAAFLGLGFAATLALFPTLTSICFGTKHLGTNYGLVFTAFGIGAVAPVVGSWLFDITGSFTPAFISAGIMSAIGMILTLTLKKKYALH
ncbi:hypothetical protein AT15_00310 [Kosmotoga arenicorallina S304]|uniref:Major facilitator superfamily (MFS) profile domain-containing protein n=1 Tax=Kosmotoga arenicorallina S304 TaxID=1453497 RepID=A0A176K0N9_9BACT|nr:OFA family MFS transporter [Kosmotoga arenicorallina]OAA30184.1 hypothetical protein AT15_00310 [Kosmotoga arenicorallina S304]